MENQIKSREFLEKYQHTFVAPCFYRVAADVVQIEAETGQSFVKIKGTDNKFLYLENRTGTFFDDGINISLLTGPCG